MLIYAIDPGESTGICKFSSFDRSWKALVLPAMAACEWIDSDALETGRWYTWIVCERFIFTSVKHSRQNDALEVIGACRYIAYKKGIAFELQNRADRMEVPIKLARDIASFKSPKPTDHELDAVRHAIVAVIRHGGIEYVPGYTHPQKSP